MPQSRQLSAIMFTDIVGYTALMGNDEKKTFEILNKNRGLQKPIIEEFDGRWIKELGDGVMASFNTVSDAVNAAIKIQQACNAAKDFQLRIGIHLGEVVFENDDVFGDGVNIAARIQAIAPIGGIYISEAVYNNIANKKEIEARFVHSEKLKNVKEPVKIYEIKSGAADTAWSFPVKRHTTSFKRQQALTPKVIISIIIFLFLVAGTIVIVSIKRNKASVTPGNEEIEKSIAVLPFVNISDDKEQEYFSDGLSEELMNLLARVHGLKVIARTSAFAFKGKNEDVRTIGEKLGVDHILEGSVQKSGNQIRIKTFLVKTSDGSQIWNETYDRQLTDIFKVQDEIASAVVNQLKLKFFGSGISTTSNAEVLNLILQGNFFLAKLDEKNVFKAIEFYKQARMIDSADARVWASLANGYAVASWQNYINQYHGNEKARQAALKAISLDPKAATGYLAVANIKLNYEFDWNGAREASIKVLQLEPSNAAAQHLLGGLNRILGNYDEAIQRAQAAILLDPLRPTSYILLGQSYTYSNNLEEANATYKKLLEIDSNFQRAHMYLGTNYILQNKLQTALEEMQKETAEVFRHFGLVLAWHALNNRKESDRLMVSFVDKYHDSWAYLIAQLHGFRGEKEKAVEWLEKALQRRDSWLVWIRRDPLLKNIWHHPGYINILKKMNLSIN
ncbi:MAG: adenylate/guanylate cyclase domain-containing protein [Chitinophagaceae bacterium]